MILPYKIVSAALLNASLTSLRGPPVKSNLNRCKLLLQTTQMIIFIASLKKLHDENVA